MRAAAAWFLVLLCRQDTPTAGNPIDADIDRKLQENGLQPAPPCSDFEFVRRVHLDLIGRPPKPDPAKAWLQNPDRNKLIGQLIESPEFADFWSEVWVKALLGFDVFNFFRQDMDYNRLREWLREQISKNRPYHHLVHDLLTATGDFKENPPVNFLIGYIKADTKQPVEAAVAVSRVFLGYQLQCAQCHDHPFDTWSKDQFWGFTALLGRTKQKVSNTFDGLKIKLIDRESGELKTEDGEIAPQLLDGTEVPSDAKRRESLSRWIIGSRQFARATVNRLWAHFMGRGIVDPIDRFVETNPPSHPELLEKLADQFQSSNYDLKTLIRSIVASKAYQRSSRGTGDAALYQRQAVRPMHPVALTNALFYSIGAEEYIKKNKDFQNGRYFFYYIIQYLMGQNAKSDRAVYEGSAQQALVFMNNKDFNAAIQAPGGIVDIILGSVKTPRERIQSIFFILYSRLPSEAELKRYEAYLKEKKDSRSAYQDVYWVLLNANEFFFNH